MTITYQSRTYRVETEAALNALIAWLQAAERQAS